MPVTYKSTVRILEGVELTETQFKGRTHLVVPCTALMEKVVLGISQTEPELVLASEIRSSVNLWSGRSIFLNHPLDEQGFLAYGNELSIIEDAAIGLISNPRMNAEGDKLLLDALIDIQTVEDFGGKALEVLEAIKSKTTTELSVGYIADVVTLAGAFSGEAYAGVQRNINPLHLAFLQVGHTGACSVEDGCGTVRLNAACQKKGMRLNETMSDLYAKVAVQLGITYPKGYIWVEDIMADSDEVIFEMWDDAASDYSLLKSSFTKDVKTGKITIEASSEKVFSDTVYRAFTKNEEEKMTPEELVAAIIESPANVFTTDDEANLKACSLTILTELNSASEKASVEPEPDDVVTTCVPTVLESNEVAKPDPLTADEWYAQAPEGVADALKALTDGADAKRATTEQALVEAGMDESAVKALSSIPQGALDGILAGMSGGKTECVSLASGGATSEIPQAPEAFDLSGGKE